MNNKHEQVKGVLRFTCESFRFFQVSHLEIFSLVENVIRRTAHVYFFLRFEVATFVVNVTAKELGNFWDNFILKTRARVKSSASVSAGECELAQCTRQRVPSFDTYGEIRGDRGGGGRRSEAGKEG